MNSVVFTQVLTERFTKLFLLSNGIPECKHVLEKKYNVLIIALQAAARKIQLCQFVSKAKTLQRKFLFVSIIINACPIFNIRKQYVTVLNN